MKKIKVIASLAAWLSAAISISAGILVYEPFDYGPSGTVSLNNSGHWASNWRFVSPQDIEFRESKDKLSRSSLTPEAIQQLKAKAIAGDSEVQMKLAKFLYSGEHGFEQNHAEAYKWACVARSQGNKNAKHLLAEFDLFMSPEEKQEGKAQAEKYLASRKEQPQKSDVKQQGEGSHPAESPQPTQ